MNTLSGLIYISDVVGSIDGPVIALTIVTAAAFIICVIGSNGSNTKTVEAYQKYASFSMWLFFGLFIIQAIVPSQETILMIAASEIGEDFIETPEMLKVREILLEKMNEYTTE